MEPPFVRVCYPVITGGYVLMFFIRRMIENYFYCVKNYYLATLI